MLTRLARWWLERQDRRARHDDARAARGECVCGKQVSGDDLHLVMALADDDAVLGIEGGQTAMSADFCAAHCPGGCTRGCVASAA